MNLVTAGGSASSAVTLPSKPSSSQLASPAAARVLRYRVSAPVSAQAAPGTKTFTPKGCEVAARTAEISAVIASGVLYPAARKPSAPALAAAMTRPGVDGPPAMGATTTGSRSRAASPLRVVGGCAVGGCAVGGCAAEGCVIGNRAYWRGCVRRASSCLRISPWWPGTSCWSTTVKPAGSKAAGSSGPGTSPATGPAVPAAPRP